MPGNVERNVLALATEQHALIARWQALQLGMTAKTIQTKVSSGAWRRLSRGLYEVSGSPPTWERRVMEAVLGAGRDAVASHVAAGRLHELLTGHPSIIDVTVPQARHPAASARRRIHRSRVLRSSDRTQVSGIPVTSVPRTLVDLADVLSDARLEAALDAALTSGRASLQAMRRYMKAPDVGKHRRISRLRRLLDDREFGVPESDLERAFERLVKSSQLPMPVRQRPVRRYRVDYLYEAQRIVVEVDGSATRSTRTALQRDRRRQNDIVLDGFLVLRFTWDDVTKDVPYVVATITCALDGAGGGS